MLQIVTRRYFTEGVDVHETPQRGVLYTNRLFLRTERVLFPIGELAPPSYTAGGVSPVGVTVVEHLEAGEDSVLVATAGTELIADFAAFLSFALNAIFTPDHDLAHRLVPTSVEQAPRDSAVTMFDGMFDPAEFVTDEELDQARAFQTELLDLRRQPYEAAMRAIKRIVRATQRAQEDPSIAYTDIVAALESLSSGTPAADPLWNDVPADVRTEIDATLAAVPPQAAGEVRRTIATTQTNRLALRLRAFISDHLDDEYFRDGAASVERPLRRLDVDRVVAGAYDIRSRNVHALAELPPEAWAIGRRGDTVVIDKHGLILTIQGLTRLARHVVRNYVRRAPRGIDPTFNWRAEIPGQLRMTLAPQYWLWQADGFNHRTAQRYFRGLAGEFIDRDGGAPGPIADMRAVLEVIEQTIKGHAAGPARDAMVGIYALWHRRVAPQFQRPDADKLLKRHRASLEKPTLIAFVTALVSGLVPEWSAEEWLALSDARIEERLREKEPSYAPTIDAALHACASEALWEAGFLEVAYAMAARAMEEAPGNEYLRTWEEGTPAGEVSEVNLTRLLHGERDETPIVWPDGPLPSA